MSAGGGARRFWTEVALVEADGGWSLTLDSRLVRTPGKALLVAPTRALAEAAAAEWRAQGEKIDPLSMPVTRTLNTAIERVATAREAVIDEIARFGGSDLLCYRADRPEALAAMQAEAWDPLIDWSRDTLDAPLMVTASIRHVAQPEASLKRFHAEVASFDAVGLTALHDLVAISGSLVIGLALARGHLSVEEAWTAALIDDAWQIMQWGEDAEAALATANRAAAFEHAARILALNTLD